MFKILKPIALCAFLVGTLFVVNPADAQGRRGGNRYWNNYWRWDDRDYRGYYNRRGRDWDDYGYRNRGYRDRYDDFDRFGYGSPYGNRGYYMYGRPYRSGIQIGPLGIGWQ